MSFRTKLMLTAILGKNKYRLVTPLSYYHAKEKKYYVVPKGFVTDFASIPFFLKWLIDDNSKHIREAAVLHDYLYSKDCAITHVTRKKADAMIWYAMHSLYAPSWKIRMVYKTLQCFGWLFFRKGK